MAYIDGKPGGPNTRKRRGPIYRDIGNYFRGIPCRNHSNHNVRTVGPFPQKTKDAANKAIENIKVAENDSSVELTFAIPLSVVDEFIKFTLRKRANPRLPFQRL